MNDPRLPGITAPSDALEAALRVALASKPAAYVPRTEHLDERGVPAYVNRLILETSPYLLHHAHNPVNWYPWGDEAFARARAENKLVLLSVGYATCHWCHVMERESFEDEEIAAVINQHFLPIKVDREERPDVDAVYMTAVQLLSGQGGWPMTMILTPERLPIFGGTYFPPRDGVRGARVGFLTLLRELAKRAQTSSELMVAQGQRVYDSLQSYMRSSPKGEVPGRDVIADVVQALSETFDPEWGGFGEAPKFPRSATLELLLRYARRAGDVAAREMAMVTLTRMAQGGLYDQVGGGFHRYSVDDAWRVPHFEKMLYDNAQLAVTYLVAWQATREPLFETVAKETLDYLAREMRGAHGAFYSATDADSPGPDGASQEGLFFTWTPDELTEVLGSHRALIASMVWGVTPYGDLDGRSVLHITPNAPLKKLAEKLRTTESALREEVAVMRRVLYEARSRRTPPLTDDKVITSWNALAISAFAKAGFAFDAPAYLDVARSAATFVLGTLRDERGLLRTFREGKARLDGYLDDYAFMVAALLDLYEASFEPRWLDEAVGLQAVMDARFWDADHGGYFFTAAEHEALLVRDKPDYDGAEPTGNSVAAQNLLRLYALTTDPAYRARAEALFAAFATTLTERGQALPRMLGALDDYWDAPLQIVVVAKDAGARDALVRPLRGAFVPNCVLVAVTEGEPMPKLSLLEGRDAGSWGRAYVCRGTACEAPTSDPEVLRQHFSR